MNRRSLFDRVRQALANVDRQVETYETTGRPAEPMRRKPVRRQEPAAPAREELELTRRRRTEQKPVQLDGARRPSLRTALASRSGLRQAILMHEILGPPMGLRMRERLDGDR
jgi:hypothetical protein